MKLETLYIQYRDKYTKTNMLSFNNQYVDDFTKIYLYISMIMAFFAILLFTFKDIFQHKWGFFVSSIAFGILAILYYLKYYKKLKESFEQSYSLQKGLKIDFIYHDVLEAIKKDDIFLSNLNKLLEFADMEIATEGKGYFYNPIIILLISFIMAVIVNFLTQSNENIPTLFNIIIAIIIILIMVAIHYSAHERNYISKNSRFKRFLLNVQFDLD
ncbi:MAG: hypothetical protein WC279_11190 [Sulfurimonas sp.]|jgi:L-asparagine transporter-like permease|uniref:hypothetical protein n=1 Tax=Sulfurimonas sp. TaxID=2022749 RepID=UPI003562DEC5